MAAMHANGRQPPSAEPGKGALSSGKYHSLANWLIAATLANLGILTAAVLGSSYTGLHGDWLEGSTQIGSQLFLAEVGLTEVRLRTGTGASRTLALKDACAEAGGVDSDASRWCALDRLGADTEAMLTAAFVPALVVLLLSAVTSLQNCCSASIAPHKGSAPLGISSALYSLATLLAWSLFFLMCTAGLCIYAYRAPASLGVGRASPSKSYGLMRACVLFTSLGALALVARSLKLWDTQTVQIFLRDVREARLLKLALYLMLGAQLLLYVPVSLVQFDYAAVICLLGINYIATRAPQMLWGYALLTIATLPQDAISLSAVVAWASMDSIDRTARVAFVLIALLKLVILFGMFLMHTRVRFKLQVRACHPPGAHPPLSEPAELLRASWPGVLAVSLGTAPTVSRVHAACAQFFEFEQLGDEEHGPPALTSGSPTAFSRGSPAYNQQSYTAGEGDVAAVDVAPAPAPSRSSLDP